MATFADPLVGKCRLSILVDHFATSPTCAMCAASPTRWPISCGWRSAAQSPTATSTTTSPPACSEAHLPFLRRHLPYRHSVPGGR